MCCAHGKTTEPRCEDATGKRGRRERKFHAANIGHMEPDAYKSVKHNIHKSKHNINDKFARMLPSQVELVSKKKQCSLPRHVDVVGNGALVDHHSAPTFAWQDDVKAAVVNAWQMSSFRHILVAGPSCWT